MISLILQNRKPKVPRDGSFRPRRAALHESGLTLVMCPSHLVAQWQSEIKNSSVLRTATICTAAEWNALTYDKLLHECDVVIISHTFLRNNAYSAACGDLSHIHDFADCQAQGKDPSTLLRRSRRTAAQTDPVINGLSTSASSPILQRIGWYRIILDEGHELVADATTHKTSTSKACVHHIVYWLDRKQVFDSCATPTDAW
jgi:SNF2 family DNA or RNA helicase